MILVAASALALAAPIFLLGTPATLEICIIYQTIKLRVRMGTVAVAPVPLAAKVGIGRTCGELFIAINEEAAGRIMCLASSTQEV